MRLRVERLGKQPLALGRALTLTLVTLTGCDWRVFDKIVADAPVQSIGAPGGYIADDIGRLIVPLPDGMPADPSSARFAFFSTSRFTGGLAQIDAAGKVVVHGLPETAAVPVQVPGVSVIPPVRAAAAEDATSLLIGTPEHGMLGAVKKGRTWRLKLVPGPTPSFMVQPHAGLRADDVADEAWGQAVAVGHVGDAATDTTPMQFQDHAVLSSLKVTYLENGVETGRIIAAPGKCSTRLLENFSEPRFVYPRALQIADVLPGGQGEILVGVPRAMDGAEGVVRVLVKVATTEEQRTSLMNVAHYGNLDHVLECPVYLTAGVDAAAPALARSRAGFGVAMARGDFNGDGRPDILVGAPPDRAYVFLGPVLAGYDPSMATQAPVAVPGMPVVPPPGVEGTGAQFGLRVAAADLDGDGRDEMIVAAPDAIVKGQTAAGRIYVYKLGNPTPMVIEDAQPQSGSSLGHDVGAVRFVAPACEATSQPARARSILLGGMRTEIFAYFGLPVATGFTAQPDLRCR